MIILRDGETADQYFGEFGFSSEDGIITGVYQRTSPLGVVLVYSVDDLADEIR